MFVFSHVDLFSKLSVVYFILQFDDRALIRIIAKEKEAGTGSVL